MYIQLPNRFSTFCMLAVPLLLFYPVILGDSRVMGAPISDMSNGLWSLWHFSNAILSGSDPLCTSLINAPNDGCLVPADWTGLIWMIPLSMVLEPIQAFNTTLYLQVVWIGMCMYLLHQAWFKAEKPVSNKYESALLSAILLQVSTVVRTGLHNGSTEVLSLGWVLLGLVGWNQVLAGYRWAWLLILPVIGTSWYGVVGFVLIAAVQWMSRRVSLSKGSLCCGAAVSSVWAIFVYWVYTLSSGTGNLLRIKGSAEMDSVRRTIGSADPLTYVVPWSYTSPDFSEVSRFGEQFVHSSYIGWVILGTCLWYTKSALRHWSIWAAGLGFLLSLGPVLVLEAEPLLIFGLGIPLPYILLESLPLFDHLTLLYRLSWVPIVCVTGFAVHHWKSRWVVLCAAAIAETLFVSPVRTLPTCTDLSFVQQVRSIKDTPEGIVGLYPLAGGRPYMASQIWHEKPLATTLNFPANEASLHVLQTIRNNESVEDKVFQTRVLEIAKSRGIRYWIVDADGSMMPDEYHKGVHRLRDAFPVLLTVEQSLQDSTECSSVWDSLYIVRLW